MANNKLLAALFSVAIATGAGVSGCISKDIYNSFTSADKLALNSSKLYENSGNHDNLIKLIIDAKIDEIINELDLYKTNDPYQQLDMCCRVQKYIIMHNYYDESMIGKKRGATFEETYMNDLYNALIYNNAICTSNSAEFKEILSRIGLDVKNVFMACDNNESHMCNIVNIGGEYYYFDPTLEKTIYDSDIYNHDNIVLFCAGMGKEDYEQYYKPIGVMDDNFGSDILEMPNNMATKSIPFEMINGKNNTLKTKTRY